MEVNMRFTNVVCVFFATALLAGCGSFVEKKKAEYKKGTVRTQSLEVPPDLTTPEFDQRYAIPGADGGMTASYSEYNKLKAEQPCVAPANAPSAAAPAAATEAKLVDENGSKRIALGEPFDRGWRRVGLALDSAHIKVSDKDRSKGIFYVVPMPNKDKKADRSKQSDYLVTVREGRDGSEVTVTDQRGKSDDETGRLIEVLYQSLSSENASGGKPSPAGQVSGTPSGDAVRPSR